MKYTSITYICPLFILFFGCSAENLERENSPLSKEHGNFITITSDSFAKSKNSTVIHNDIGVYSKLAVKPDAKICISSSRYFPLDEEHIEASYTPNCKQAKFSFDINSASAISINGKHLFAPLTKSSAPEPNFIENLFGTRVKFNLNISGSHTKSGEEDSSEELYAPEIVRIEFPSSVVTKENPTPVCHYKDFVVRWNADSNNENGVSIITKWMGIVAFGDDYPPTEVIHIASFPDTGQATLDESMFNDMPDAAFCHLIVARGDVKNLNNDDETYQLMIETHDVLSFVLVRNTQEL